MISIFNKEINHFFSSLIAYIVIIVFLVVTGLFIWVIPDTSVLKYNFATLEQLFSMAPLLFLFLIPAVTMSSFADEKQQGTLELLSTKPITSTSIVLGKYLANHLLALFALIPTLIYYYSVYQLGSPVGNLDSGGILGSYIGLFFLAGVYVSIGIFASSLTHNQIVAFVIGAFLCFVVHYGFSFLSDTIFDGQISNLISKFGIEYHYQSISRGVLDSRDVIYFISLIIGFNALTIFNISK